MIDIGEVGEPHGLLFDYDLATIERLLQFGGELGLPSDRLTTIGYTVDIAEFDDAVDVMTADTEGSAIIKSDDRWFAVVELAKPLVHGICQVEVIQSKTPIPSGEYVGVNQAHYIVSASDLVAIHSSLSSDIASPIEIRPGGFAWIRVETGSDTHIKIRDHSAMDLVLHSLSDLATRHRPQQPLTK